jgi:PAS domain S-box-containing protein
MGSDAPKTDSGTYRAMLASSEALALREVVTRMFLAQEPAEVARLLAEAGRRQLGARDAAVFLYAGDPPALAGGAAALLPETAVADYVFAEGKPATVPHADGRFITAFPLRVRQERVGLLVLDVTGMAEEVAAMNLEPVSFLADQAAVILANLRLVTRSIGESTLLSNILDSITNAIVTLDNDRRITRLNRNAMAMLEIAADAIGRPYPEVLVPEVGRAVDEILHDLGQLGFAMERMVTARLPQGLELPMAVSGSILRDEHFVPLGWIIVLRDMTASRELERLRKLDQMKSEFVANVSHELKTPLTSIKAYTEALLDMDRDPQVQAFLKVIDEESDRLLFLINDLLNVSRIQSGRMKMHFELVRPRSIVDEILHIPRVQSDRHQILLEIADDLPEMLLDKEKMKEVVVNLISNAIKYSPRGGRVWVRLRPDGTNLRLEVQDEGIGIPPEHQKNLFQAFYRVDSSHTAQIPGTGLGLVIVKAIVEQHGGRVWLESEVGRGTTFFALIPARREIRRGEPGSELGSMA